MTETKNSKYDIGIMGFWCGLNYGSVLTYYALNKVLNDMGYSVLMIEKPAYTSDPELDINTHSRQFAINHYNISQYRTIEQLPELNNHCNTFLLGSDQVFNPGCYKGFKNTLFFDFVDDNKKKIAYASSFGHDSLYFPITEKIKLNYYLNKFDGLSVREKSGVHLLKKMGLKSEHVLDPIFICDVKHYENLITEVDEIQKQPFVLSYILDPNQGKKKLIQEVMVNKNLQGIHILDGLPHKYEKNKELLNLDGILPPTNIQTVLAHYKNAEFVITDSFHGTCMAILFKKPFIAIANRHRGVSRFVSLLQLLKLTDRLIYKIGDEELNNKALLNEIDYEAVYSILNQEKEKSFNWLKNTLNKKAKNKKDNIFDKIIRKYFESGIDESYVMTYLRYAAYKINTYVSFGKSKNINMKRRDKYHNEVRKIRNNRRISKNVQ